MQTCISNYNNNQRLSTNLVKQLIAFAFFVLAWSTGTSFAGNSGTVGGHGGNSFPAVFCPSSDQRVIGFRAATTTDGNIPYVLGVKAICKPMQADGKWGGTSGSIYTRYQKGITGWQNDSEKSRACPDDMWVAGLEGSTRKFGPAPVLTRLKFLCYRANAQGKRYGSGTWRTLVSEPGQKAGRLFCPGGEIARGFYGKSGNYLDQVGLKCVQAPGKASKVLTKPVVLRSTLLTWTQGFTAHWIDLYDVPSSGAPGSPTNLLGQPLKDVFAGNAVVRNDGLSCVDCHSTGSNGATFTTNTSRTQACSELNDFASANKPANLKTMVQQWKQRGCP